MRELTRRELLAFFLGAPVAAACGRRRAPELRFEGRIAGAPAALGHRLRDGPRPKPDSESRCAVLIVGAGVAGLSAGWRF